MAKSQLLSLAQCPCPRCFPAARQFPEVPWVFWGMMMMINVQLDFIRLQWGRLFCPLVGWLAKQKEERNLKKKKKKKSMLSRRRLCTAQNRDASRSDYRLYHCTTVDYELNTNFNDAKPIQVAGIAALCRPPTG
jgi:hypothetical protein